MEQNETNGGIDNAKQTLETYYSQMVIKTICRQI